MAYVNTGMRYTHEPRFPEWDSPDAFNWQKVAYAYSYQYMCVKHQSTQDYTTFGSLSGTAKWVGGVLAPNGKIYGIPCNATTVLEIDPVTKTATTFGSLSSGTAKWDGGVLAPNGKIYGIPRNATTVLEIGPIYNSIDPNFALNPYFNKF